MRSDTSQGPETGSPRVRRNRLQSPSRASGGPCVNNPTEREILKAIRKYLESIGCYVIRQQQGLGQRRGVPDLLVCCNGRFLALEVKRPSGRLSPHQAVELERARAAGAIAEVVHSVHELKNILTSCNLITYDGDDDV